MKRVLTASMFAAPRAMRRWAIVNVFVNVLIVVTGGAVRLTDSGLGCPEWPQCEPGTMTPTAEMGIHGAIEFGNRLLTFVLLFVALGTLLAAYALKQRRPDLVTLGWLVLAIIPTQAIIGGITVWSNLNPWVVGLHFLASIGCIAAATALFIRAGENYGQPRLLVPRPIWRLGQTLIGAVLLVIALGVVVTGSGPHAGDPDSPRINLDSELLAQLHADAVWAVIGLSIAMMFALFAVKAPELPKRAMGLFMAIVALQAVIGYVQFYTGVPELLVGMHMLGACLLWIAVINVTFSLRTLEAPEASPMPGAEVPAEEEAPRKTAATSP
ncbi:COX15/CtaA family protein [Natronoglycomyces albus]|uniref:Heme A synthase n=1 Tax=Natronoglycomyces albus TaxID=2811108 RepID=A0A895XJX4_9ACTN|nr:COX15/CtaA family protein [Natronoglycomyces albus]QSB03863.1 heme A synthase [Natronoglycomyces albus]